MNQHVATTEKRSVIAAMATRYDMEPEAFEATVRETCSPKGRDARALTKPEFAAFLVVAKEYGLNPLTKEIYAFPAKGGGIVPVLSIDGWVSLVNKHPQCDGFTFDMHHDENGRLVSCMCKIYRKDRSHPIEVTEYLAECKRPTEPWKMEHRMLRHKALIQAARYAFGFSGIYDEDEGDVIANARDVTPPAPPPPPPAPPHSDANAAQAPREGDVIDGEVIENDEAETATQAEPALKDAPLDPNTFLDLVERSLDGAKSKEDVTEAWDELDVEASLTDHPDELGIAIGLRDQRLGALR